MESWPRPKRGRNGGLQGATAKDRSTRTVMNSKAAAVGLGDRGASRQNDRGLNHVTTIIFAKRLGTLDSIVRLSRFSARRESATSQRQGPVRCSAALSRRRYSSPASGAVCRAGRLA